MEIRDMKLWSSPMCVKTIFSTSVLCATAALVVWQVVQASLLYLSWVMRSVTFSGLHRQTLLKAFCIFVHNIKCVVRDLSVSILSHMLFILFNIPRFYIWKQFLIFAILYYANPDIPKISFHISQNPSLIWLCVFFFVAYVCLLYTSRCV